MIKEGKGGDFGRGGGVVWVRHPTPAPPLGK